MVELISGFPLFVQQYNALLKKNSILTLRSKRSTFFQLFASFTFFLLIFSLQKLNKKLFAEKKIFRNVIDRKPTLSVDSPIPACDRKFMLKRPCYDFVWSGHGSAEVEEIVKRIMRNNPKRPISADRVKSFKTDDEADAWLLSNPLSSPGALHFVERNKTVISFGLETDSSSTARRGFYSISDYRDSLQFAAEREIARSLLQDPNFSWSTGHKEFAHPVKDAKSESDKVSNFLYLAIAMFGFIFQIGSLVTERELKLRQAMSMMGLYESAYWLSWASWEAMLAFASSLLTVLFGWMFRFDLFRLNNFALVFLVFFLFQLSMVGFAFMVSAFIKDASQSTIVGFGIFVAGFVAQLKPMYNKSTGKNMRALWSLFPPNLFNHAMDLLDGGAKAGEGISWSKRGKCRDEDCIMTLEDTLRWLLGTFFLWFFLAIYVNNILPNSDGVKKSPLYFLMPSYWTGEAGTKGEEVKGLLPESEMVSPEDDDVLAEETAVKLQARDNVIDPNIAVQIHGLQKSYPGRSKDPFNLNRTPAFHAVKGLWVNLPKNQLFCLLGPNGAGKTTAISCLTGITPATGGDAFIYGHSVRSSVGMSNIRKIIGVCPQFDILWEALTGREHLHLFSKIKGLPPSIVGSESENALEKVKLTSSSQVRAGSYSGGMRRRLSVAIALIGDPKLVFLDEPTTGMDPISRRQVWDIIEDAKKGRAIILTTHSMEEADILSDRIAIMAKGRLRCIGTSIRLKSKFGSGYIATVNLHGNSEGDEATSEDQAEPVKKFFKHELNLEPTEENNKFLTFTVPHEKEPLLPSFFAKLQEREEELGIADIQIGLTTLEEVFLSIAKQAELESAANDGTLIILTLSNGSEIQIPKGARFVGIPGTESLEHPRGLMVEVYWEQDEDGELYASGCSSESPVPPQYTAKALNSTTSSNDIPIGLVIELEHR